MDILGALRSFFGRQRARKNFPAARSLPLNVRARYDAAQTNDDNRRHWAAADDLSALAANSPEVRRVLRKRSRYEVANNSYARGIILTLANDCIGTGPRFQSRIGKKSLDAKIETEFGQWAKLVRMADKLRVARMAKAQDGESFIRFIGNPKLPKVQTDLQLIEADQIANPAMAIFDPFEVDGIRIDGAGNPVSYSMLTQHPGDGIVFMQSDYVRVRAEDMIHWQRIDRPGQMRGIPEITAALGLFADLRRFTAATIAAAETAADFAGMLQSTAAAADEDVEPETMDTIEIEKRMLTVLPKGWAMAQMKAEHPATTYEMFVKAILKEIARCLNMPFNIAAGDSSQYNYASGRMDHQTYFKSIKVEQSHCEAAVLDRIFAAWLWEASRMDGYLPRSIRSIDDVPHEWFWDGTEHVDPTKEATAQTTRLAAHTTTLACEYAKEGKDWEAELRQRAKEIALMKELGLPMEQPKGAEQQDDQSETDTVLEEEPAYASE